MIRRTLVPLQLTPVKPGAPGENGHRRTSALDVRTVVPSEPSSAPFDASTAIPAHLPLDVLSARMLIPRDMPVKQMETTTAIPSHVPLAVLGTRVVVPPEAKFDRNAPIAPAAPLPAILFEDIIEPDLFTTGQVNLLASPDKANARAKDWQWLSRSFSLIVHVGVILFVLLAPRMFPNNSPADQEVNLARQQLSSVFLPPSVKEVPKARPKVEPESSKIRLDPRILQKLAQTPPAPEPLTGPKNNAPPQPEQTQPAQTPPPLASPPPPAFQSLSQMLKPPKTDRPLNLQLPRLSPQQELQKSAENALRNASENSNSAAFSEPMPRQRGGLPPSGEGGQGLLGAGVQILTPTEGVDFSNYITRLLARVKQNWEAVMPVSAQMGEKGVVVLQFHIMRNGDLPGSEPFLVRTSGEGSLDGAARSAITASNPFETLPPAFSGPYIELRIIFLYNLPLDYNYGQ
ncbi:MAG TPA: TonB C-terminal domain-containing protein [Candidatus Acidoferrales bacterium]|nr:TonB C-terminal domain-containing protein [Candidatus Acidoferrales bacterium]